MKKFHLMIVALVAVFVFAGCNGETDVVNSYRAEISDYSYASPVTGTDIKTYLDLFDLWNGTDMKFKGASTAITDLEAIAAFNSSLLLVNSDSIANRLGENDYIVYRLKRNASENANEEILKSVRFTHSGREDH